MRKIINTYFIMRITQFASASTVVSNPYFSVSASATASSTAGAASSKSATVIASNLSQKEAISKMNKLLKKHKLEKTPSTAVTTYKLTGSPSAAAWSGISIRGNNAIACVGDYTITDSNYIYYSRDGGKTWNQSNAPNYPWSSVSIGDSKALASNITNQQNNLYYSTDSGISWFPDNDKEPIINVTISGENAIKVISLNYYTEKLYYANNASTSTNINWVSSQTTDLSYVTFVSNSGSNAVLCQQDGYIYYSNDSGKTWTQSNSPSMYWLSVSISGSNAVACDDTTYNTYYSNDYGKTWKLSNPPPNDPFTSSCNCVSISGKYAVAGANGGYIYYSDDSGANWNKSTSDQKTWWRISIDGANAVACVNGGNIYYSTDYGASWNES